MRAESAELYLSAQGFDEIHVLDLTENCGNESQRRLYRHTGEIKEGTDLQTWTPDLVPSAMQIKCTASGLSFKVAIFPKGESEAIKRANC